jgi:type I restriction enzyme S subunit
MKKETKKAPTIRFRGFTDDWEQHKFGEIAEYKKGPFGSALKKDFFIPDSATSVKVYEQQNAINKNWNLSRYYISKEYAQKLKSFEVHAGDIIVSCAGTIGEIYELPAQSRSGIINQALMRIRVDEKTVCKDIFKLAFSNMIDSFSREFSNGSAIKNIPPFADLKPMKVLLPNKDEQKIIGDFFTDIDKTITLHQRKLDQLKTLKKYFLQNMFPAKGEKVPRIRFKGFTGDWEQRKVSDIAGRYDNLRVPVSSNKRVHGTTPYYGANGVQDYVDGYTHDGEYILIAEDGANDLQNYPVHYVNGRIWVNNHAHVLQGKTGIADTKFLSYAFSQIDISSLLVGGGRAKLNADLLMKLDLLLPEHKEQEKLGNYFSHIDSLIALHQHKLDQLQTMKKFMLQNLFI